MNKWLINSDGSWECKIGKLLLMWVIRDDKTRKWFPGILILAGDFNPKDCLPYYDDLKEAKYSVQELAKRYVEEISEGLEELEKNDNQKY